MRLATSGLPVMLTPPRVVWRSAVGVGVVLLILQFLTVGRSAPRESLGIVPEQARLRLDPNVATREELMLLPRIGPALADAIVAYRESRGPGPAFFSAEDLENVHRVGPVTVEALRPLLRFPSDSVESGKPEVGAP